MKAIEDEKKKLEGGDVPGERQSLRSHHIILFAWSQVSHCLSYLFLLQLKSLESPRRVLSARPPGPPKHL